MMKLTRSSIQFLLLGTVAAGIILASQSWMPYTHALPSAPNSGTPKGTPTNTATRPPACFSVDRSATLPTITALVNNQGYDFTLSQSPTLWIYIPYLANSVREIDLAILNEQETNTFSKRSFRASQTPGFFPLPMASTGSQPFTLQPNTNYRWVVNLYCSNHQSSEPDVTLKGWIQRRPMTNTIQQQLSDRTLRTYEVYRQNQIWYDAIDSLAQSYFADRTDPNLQTAWTNLLKTYQPKSANP